MNKTKLNPGLVASYDLWPGNRVVTILVEWEGMDDRRRTWLKQTSKGKKEVKKSKR